MDKDILLSIRLGKSLSPECAYHPIADKATYVTQTERVFGLSRQVGEIVWELCCNLECELPLIRVHVMPKVAQIIVLACVFTQLANNARCVQPESRLEEE